MTQKQKISRQLELPMLLDVNSRSRGSIPASTGNTGLPAKTVAECSLKEASASDLYIYKQITDNYFRGLNKA